MSQNKIKVTRSLHRFVDLGFQHAIASGVALGLARYFSVKPFEIPRNPAVMSLLDVSVSPDPVNHVTPSAVFGRVPGTDLIFEGCEVKMTDNSSGDASGDSSSGAASLASASNAQLENTRGLFDKGILIKRKPYTSAEVESALRAVRFTSAKSAMLQGGKDAFSGKDAGNADKAKLFGSLKQRLQAQQQKHQQGRNLRHSVLVNPDADESEAKTSNTSGIATAQELARASATEGFKEKIAEMALAETPISVTISLVGSALAPTHYTIVNPIPSRDNKRAFGVLKSWTLEGFVPRKMTVEDQINSALLHGDGSSITSSSDASTSTSTSSSSGLGRADTVGEWVLLSAHMQDPTLQKYAGATWSIANRDTIYDSSTQVDNQNVFPHPLPGAVESIADEFAYKEDSIFAQPLVHPSGVSVSSGISATNAARLSAAANNSNAEEEPSSGKSGFSTFFGLFGGSKKDNTPASPKITSKSAQTVPSSSPSTSPATPSASSAAPDVPAIAGTVSTSGSTSKAQDPAVIRARIYETRWPPVLLDESLPNGGPLYTDSIARTIDKIPFSLTGESLADNSSSSSSSSSSAMVSTDPEATDNFSSSSTSSSSELSSSTPSSTSTSTSTSSSSVAESKTGSEALVDVATRLAALTQNTTYYTRFRITLTGPASDSTLSLALGSVEVRLPPMIHSQLSIACYLLFSTCHLIPLYFTFLLTLSFPSITTFSLLPSHLVLWYSARA